MQDIKEEEEPDFEAIHVVTENDELTSSFPGSIRLQTIECSNIRFNPALLRCIFPNDHDAGIILFMCFILTIFVMVVLMMYFIFTRIGILL